MTNFNKNICVSYRFSIPNVCDFLAKGLGRAVLFTFLIKKEFMQIY